MEKLDKPIGKVVKRDFSDTDIAQFIRDAAQIANKTGVRSALVLTVDENNHCHWYYKVDNELHACLMVITMGDAVEDVKAAEIFKDVDLE